MLPRSRSPPPRGTVSDLFHPAGSVGPIAVSATEEPSSTTLLLTGPRGCGKTTLLLNLCYALARSQRAKAPPHRRKCGCFKVALSSMSRRLGFV